MTARDEVIQKLKTIPIKEVAQFVADFGVSITSVDRNKEPERYRDAALNAVLQRWDSRPIARNAACRILGVDTDEEKQQKLMEKQTKAVEDSAKSARISAKNARTSQTAAWLSAIGTLIAAMMSVLAWLR